MKTLLNPGLKPVHSVILYLLAGCFIVLNLFAISCYYMISRSEDQIIQAVEIRSGGAHGYEISFENQGIVKLSSEDVEKIVAFEDCTALTKEQQDIVNERYLGAWEKFPARFYLYLNEYPFLAVFIALILVGCVLFDVIFMIFQLVSLYRAWKSLQTLSQVDPSNSGGMTTPGKTVGFLFIPGFFFYWVFRAFGGLEGKGRAFAAKTGEEYRGPSKLLGVSFSCICVWNVLTFYADFDYMSLPWILDMAVWVLMLALWPLMIFKLNAMTRSFAGAAIDEDDPVWVLAGKSRFFNQGQ